MKVLITSLSAGSGHVRAAEAVLATCQEVAPGVEAVHVDVANFVSPNFRRLYVEGYRVAVQRAPALWGKLYHYSDNSSFDGLLSPLLHRIQRSCATGFYAYLQRFRPDLILTTHFLIPQLIAAERHHPSFGPPVETIITDYVVHRFWISDVVTRYHVAHEDMIASLSRYGVPRSRVVVSGIPVHPVFLKPASLSQEFLQLNLDSRRPTVLMLSGGLGLFELEDAVKRLLTLSGEPQIITVAGKNEILRARLDKLRVPAGTRLINLGYVRNMQELLDASDVVLTKPGGLTVTECMAKKKLMVLFSPIPGQEEENADFLVSRGAALRVHSFEGLPQAVSTLLNDKALASRILANVERIARPQAAYAIAQTITRTSSLAA